MTETKKARAVGFNHIALEVGDIDEALAFYGGLFDFELRGRSENSAFIDLGDQFLALQKGRRQSADDGRHFGLVVDDKEAVRLCLIHI
jgi:lactoylglutathione lyase